MSLVAIVISIVSMMISFFSLLHTKKGVLYSTKPDIIFSNIPNTLLTCSNNENMLLVFSDNFQISNIGQGYAKNVNIIFLLDSESYLKTQILYHLKKSTVYEPLTQHELNKNFYVLHREYIPIFESKQKYNLFQNMGLAQYAIASDLFIKDMTIFADSNKTFLNNFILKISYKMFDGSSKIEYYSAQCTHNKWVHDKFVLAIQIHNINPPKLRVFNPFRPSRKSRYK